MDFELHEEHLDVMRHALGIEKRRGRWTIGGWRNRYVILDAHDTSDYCEELVDNGYMKKTRLDKRIFGGAWCYLVTERGKIELKKRNHKIMEVD